MSAIRKIENPNDYAPARGLHRIVLMRDPADPPMPHELLHDWAERMRRAEAVKDAPAESNSSVTP